MISHGCTNQLPTENTRHIRRVNPIPRFRHNRINRAPIRNLARLQPQIDGKSLDHGPSDGESAGIGPDDDANEAEAEAQDDGKERHEAVDDKTGVRRAEEHACNADEGEEADDERRVGIRRGGEQEGQSGPVGHEGSGSAEADQTGLREDGFREQDLGDRDQNLWVSEPGWVGGGVVGHEEPK